MDLKAVHSYTALTLRHRGKVVCSEAVTEDEGSICEALIELFFDDRLARLQTE
jgi:hypothetical protein